MQLGRDWVQATASAPWQPRFDHASVVYDGKIWVIFGQSGPLFPDIWSSPDGLHWTLVSQMVPGLWARWGHTAVVHEGKMWVIGGATDHADVWYSTDGVRWTSATLNAPWGLRNGHASVVFAGRMWVLGGDASGYKNDVWSSSNGASWTLATAHAQWQPRAYHSAVVFDNKIWVIGGEGGPVSYTDVWCSANGTTWTLVASSTPWLGGPDARAVVCDGKIWVMGGWSLFYTVERYVSDVWSSPDGIHWTQATAAAPWHGRVRFTVVVHKRKMWVLGGVYDSGRPFHWPTFLNDVWYSDLPTAVSRWQLYR